MSLGNKLEDYVRSQEPETRSAALLLESGKRLKIKQSALEEIIKPYTVHIQRLSVPILGTVVNVMSGIVLHNRARGPYKGGIRIAHDVDLWETTELARLMTLKTALSGVELGGGKSGVSVDLRKLYQRMIKEKRFSGEYRDFVRIANADIMDEFTDQFGWLFEQHLYIPAPDMGTSGNEMVRIYNSTHDPASVTGKPVGIEGWLPGRAEATGYGAYYAIIKHMEQQGVAPDSCKVAIQGFGNVGRHVARFLFDHGVKVIAVTDITGGVMDPDGLDIHALWAHTDREGGVKGYKAKPISNDALFKLPCEYLIPAACGHVIHKDNAGDLGAAVVVEAANMPVTFDGMTTLFQKGVEIIPDTYANAGGVIASDIEYRQALGGIKFNREMTLAHIRQSFDTMYDAMRPHLKKGRTLLQASMDIALQRVYDTMLQRSLL